MRAVALALIAAAAGGGGGAAAIAAGGSDATAAIAVADPGPSRVVSGGVGPARIEGHFAVAGRVTAAQRVAGAHRGERLRRSWTLSGEDCATSSCPEVRLTARLGFSDATLSRLTLRRAGPGEYRWRHTVTAATLCHRRHLGGVQRATAALTVTVSSRAEVRGVWYATALRATGSGSSGGCGATTTRFAVTYAGTVRSGVPAAALGPGSAATTSRTTTSRTTTSGATTSRATTAAASTTAGTPPSSTGTTPTISSTPSPTVPTTTTDPREPQPEAGVRDR